ncbi:MAG TPA: ABC transporter permease [Acidisphaera sp.]|nr:ABC transporter permease [Acidisphaera sp.]
MTARWLQRIALAFVLPLVLLAAWTYGSRCGWVPEQILPPPDAVWASLADLWTSGELWTNALVSLDRVAQGFAAGTAAGFALGLAMGCSRPVEAYVRPLFTALAQVPALGWIPLLMLLVGIGEPLKLIVIARAVLVPVALNTLAGVRGVPLPLLEVGRVLRFSRAQMLLRIVLPASVPSVFAGIRYGLTHAWIALVAVELIASSEGLGYLLLWGRQMFQLDQVIAAMAVIGITGFVMDAALGVMEARLQRRQPVAVRG